MLATQRHHEFAQLPAFVASRDAAAAAHEHDQAVGIEHLGVVVRVQAGRSLASDDQSVTDYYEVVTGTLRSSVLLADGRRQVLEFLLPGDFLSDPGSSQDVEAIVDTTLIRYRRRQLDALAVADSSVATQLLARACSQISRARCQMLLLGRKNAEERVASFLLSLARRLPGSAQKISLPMTRSDIADYLGLTTETVSRTLSALVRQGLIAIERSDIVLLDQEALEELDTGC